MGLFSKKTKEETKDTVKKTEAKVKVADKKETKKPVIKKTEVKKTVNKSDKKSDKKNGEAYRFLLRPIISEKATIGAADGKYTFEVSMDANKVAIKQAIQEVYGVKAIAVNVINKRGKNVRFGRKYGRTKNIKKVVITLKKGESIKLYEGI